MTIRQLLDHSSGIPEHLNANSYLDVLNGSQEKYSAEEALTYIYGAKPWFAPGTDRNYSNSNYLLLAMIIKAATGAEDSYDLLRQKVFIPAGMYNTYPGTSIPADMTLGYYSTVKGWMKELTAVDHAAVGGKDRLDGGVISTSEDLVKFLNALYDGKLISASSLALMRDLHPVKAPVDIITGYGLGMMKLETPDGVAEGHYGTVYCFNAAIFRFIGQDLTVAFCINGSSADIQELHYSKEIMANIFE